MEKTSIREQIEFQNVELFAEKFLIEAFEEAGEPIPLVTNRTLWLSAIKYITSEVAPLAGIYVLYSPREIKGAFRMIEFSPYVPLSKVAIEKHLEAWNLGETGEEKALRECEEGIVLSETDFEEDSEFRVRHAPGGA